MSAGVIGVILGLALGVAAGYVLGFSVGRESVHKCQFTVQDVKTEKLEALMEVCGVWHYPTARFSPAMPEGLIKELLEKELLKRLSESGAIKYDCIRYSERPIVRATLEIVRR